MPWKTIMVREAGRGIPILQARPHRSEFKSCLCHFLTGDLG